MKTVLKVVGVLFVLFLTMLAVNQAFRMLNAASDVSVAGGILLLLGVLGFYIWAVSKVYKSCRSTSRMVPVLIFCAVALALSSGCGKINPGHVGIVVNNWGSDRGVQGADLKYDRDGHAILPDNMVIVTGGYTYNPFTSSVFEWPTSVQRAIWTKSLNEGKQVNEEICYNSREGLVFCADIGFSYHLQAKYVPAFYVKFRSADMDAFTHGFLRDVARNAMNDAGKLYSTDELYGEKKEEFLQEAQKRVNTKLEPYGVVIDNFGYASPARPPDTIVKAINDKLQATQRAMQAENELREAKAQAAKAVAKADGEAQANVKLSASLTPALLEWRRLRITELAIAKWNGARPMVEGNNSGLLLNIAPPKQ